MKNPLIKRFPRELKSEFGKYLVIFLFIAGTISIVSGWNVAGSSMSTAYDESFEKYSLNIYENFYIERSTKEVDSTLRVFHKRDEINRECLMEGEFPASDTEIAIDRMYADNNEISVGDTLTFGDKEFTVSGLVALSDYSALFSSPSDMMFDAVKFGVAVVTGECFDSLGENGLHYSYSWKYDECPADDIQAKELSEEFLENLYEQSALHENAVVEYIPEYTNQAIIFTGDDIKGDSTFAVT